MTVSLIKDILLGIVSLLLFVLGFSIGFIAVQIVGRPRSDFTTKLILLTISLIPGTGVKQFLINHLLKRQDDSDFDKRRFQIALMGSFLAFNLGIVPIMFYYDIRMYLFFLGMGIFFGVLGLAWYYLWIFIFGK